MSSHHVRFVHAASEYASGSDIPGVMLEPHRDLTLSALAVTLVE